jgi:hypothetical protein
MGDLDGLALKPWQQQSEESNKAFHAFTHFLSLLPHERSMDRAYTRHQRDCKQNPNTTGNQQKLLSCSSDWQDWRFRFSWLERAAQHDADVAERNRLLRVHDIEEMNKRHTSIAVALQNIVVDRLQEAIKAKEVFTMTPTQMAALLDRAAVVERRSRGEATSIVQHQDGGSSAMALDLSKLNDQELEQFQKLVSKAEPSTPKVEV